MSWNRKPGLAMIGSLLAARTTTKTNAAHRPAARTRRLLRVRRVHAHSSWPPLLDHAAVSMRREARSPAMVVPREPGAGADVRRHRPRRLARPRDRALPQAHRAVAGPDAPAPARHWTDSGTGSRRES